MKCRCTCHLLKRFGFPEKAIRKHYCCVRKDPFIEKLNKGIVTKKQAMKALEYQEKQSIYIYIAVGVAMLAIMYAFFFKFVPWYLG